MITQSWLTNRGYETFGPGAISGAHRTGDRKSERKSESVRERRAFAEVRRAEMSYARQLRSVAGQVGVIVRGLTPRDGVPDSAQVERALRGYSEILRPWARVVGQRMLDDVRRRDLAVWRSLSQDMTTAMRAEIERAPTGEALRRLLDEQISLITSIPLRAAERARKLADEAHVSGQRAATIVDQIQASGHVARSRAELIARTEVARAASGLVQARATYVGSEGYVWRTAEDHDVRRSHKKMSGKFVRWDRPPVTDGLTGHAGQLPNCRCYPEPVLPDFIQ